MEFDLNKFAPVPNDWFQANIEYTGYGRAEFLDPKGTVEGNVKIRFDDFGKNEITMDVVSVNSKQNIFKLFIQNTCRYIEVATVDGKFYSISNVLYGEHISSDVDKGTEIKLNFYISRSMFQSNKAGPAYYWVLPLSNFISDFMSYYPKLDHHALRMFLIPSIPDDLDENQKLFARAKTNENNRLIVFTFL